MVFCSNFCFSDICFSTQLCVHCFASTNPSNPSKHPTFTPSADRRIGSIIIASGPLFFFLLCIEWIIYWYWCFFQSVCFIVARGCNVHSVLVVTWILEVAFFYFLVFLMCPKLICRVFRDFSIVFRLVNCLVWVGWAHLSHPKHPQTPARTPFLENCRIDALVWALIRRAGCGMVLWRCFGGVFGQIRTR